MSHLKTSIPDDDDIDIIIKHVQESKKLSAETKLVAIHLLEWCQGKHSRDDLYNTYTLEDLLN